MAEARLRRRPRRMTAFLATGALSAFVAAAGVLVLFGLAPHG